MSYTLYSDVVGYIPTTRYVSRSESSECFSTTHSRRMATSVIDGRVPVLSKRFSLWTI